MLRAEESFPVNYLTPSASAKAFYAIDYEQ